MKKDKQFLIISADALISEDLEFASALPAFRYLLENGSRVSRLRSIYPTLTYPCHTTMLTGCLPDRHGVCNNEVQQPGVVSPPWLWYHDPVRVPDLMDVCKAAGYSTGSVSWPVTGNHPSIDYLVDEIWPYPIPADNGEAVAALRKTLLGAGTSPQVLADCAEDLLSLRMRRHQPETAWFSTTVCARMIRNYQPEVLTLHIANIDAYRHESGVYGPHIEQALRETDQMLTVLFEALEDAGIREQTDIVLTADHGQMDIDRKVAVNVLFREAGLIRTDAEGAVTDWDAWCFYAGTSAQVRLRDPGDTRLREIVFRLLTDRLAAGDSGFSAVYSEEDLKKDRLAGNFSFVLETDGHTGFSPAWTGDYLRPLPGPAGSHGFHPDKGPRPPLLCCGPSFRTGVVLEDADLADGAPTWAKLLGVELPDADGRVLEELLR